MILQYIYHTLEDLLHFLPKDVPSVHRSAPQNHLSRMGPLTRKNVKITTLPKLLTKYRTLQWYTECTVTVQFNHSLTIKNVFSIS